VLLDSDALVDSAVRAAPAAKKEVTEPVEPFVAPSTESPVQVNKVPTLVGRQPSQAERESLRQLEAIIFEQPGRGTNQILRLAHMKRQRTLKLLSAHCGTLWKAERDGQRVRYYPATDWEPVPALPSMDSK
jgi:hypothetical protein